MLHMRTPDPRLLKLMAPCRPAAVGQFLDLVESTATDQPMQDALKKVRLLCNVSWWVRVRA